MLKHFTRYCLALALVLGISSQSLYATHIRGSDISFRCLGGNNYEVVVAVYRDCSGVTVPTSINVNVNSLCGTSTVTCTQDAATSGLEVSQLCPTAVSTCAGGSLPGVELYTYIGSITIQPGCGLYTFSYDDCCRNTSNNLVDNAPPSLGFYVEATLNSDLVTCDAAPIFTSLPVPYFCVNQPVNYSHGSIDTDGDSLVYTLITPLDQGGANHFYQGAYSATSPLPTASGFNFDPASGQMTFTPTQQGVYVVDVLVTEYRNGVVIGTTQRDIQIVIINCSNNAPTIANCLSNANVTGAVVNDCNSLGVCPGTTVTFTIPGYDADGQPITVTSNIAASIPGATLTTTNVGGPDSIVTVFSWTPSPLDTGFRYFTVQFEDNACPITGLQLFTYDITIFDGTDAGPDRFYCTGGGPVQVNVYGGTHFSWSTTTGMVSATPDSNVVFLAPSGNTTYIISSDLQGGCKDKDTITVFNVPSYTTNITTPDDTICLHESTTLTVTATPQNQGPFTYSWTPVNQGILTPTQQTTQVKPTATTMYQVAVVSNSGCIVRDSFEIAINGVGPRVSILPSDNYVCPGSLVTLTASVSAVDCGPAPDPQNACLPNSTFDLQDVGTGTGAAGVNTTPYTGFYMDGRVQYLYRASELQALGLTAGAITDIAFNVSTKASTQPYNAFTIKMTCTSLDNLPTNYVAGLSQVLNPVSYTTTTGWNNHTLDIPYNWDGFSNLIIEVCYDNSSYTGYDQVFYTPTSFTNSVLWANNDLATQSGCSGITFTTPGVNRPNTEFVMCKAPLTNYNFTWTGSNGTTLPDTSIVTVPVNSNVDYNLIVTDANCQGDTSISLFVDTAVLISLGNDTAVCGNDTLQLNAALLHPAVPFCIPGYNLSAIPYATIAPTGTTTTGPAGDDVVSASLAMPFNFNFFCNSVSNYIISTNGFISFSTGQGAGCCAGQSVPDVNTPNNLIALCWADLNTTAGGNIDRFVTGTTPNQVLVVRWNNVSHFTGGGNITGEMHLYETTNVIELMVGSQTHPTHINTLGIENNNGTYGLTPAGYNSAAWTVSSPVAFRFTPQSAGNAVTNVSWTPTTGLSSDTILNPKAFPAVTTTYIVNATFTNGCTSHDTIKVSIGNFPHTLAAVPDSICVGDTTHLIFNGNGVSYLWTPNGSISSITAQSPFAWPYNTTTYHVTAFDSIGCRVDDTLNVIVKDHSASLGADAAICPYDSLTLIPTGGPYVSYLWSTGANTPTITTGAQTASTQSYFVRVNDGQCNYNSDTVIISEFVLNPIVVQPSGDTGVCVGETIVLGADGGYDVYLWSNGANTQFITTGTAGFYSYIAVDTNGCTLYSQDTAHVIVAQPPVAAIIVSDDTICENQSTSLLTVNPVNGIDYFWNPGGVQNDSFTVSTAGDYYLIASDNGCNSYDTVTIASVVPPVADLGADQTMCSCDTAIVLASNITGTYLWSNAATTPSISVATTGTYTLTVTDLNNCSASDAADITIRCLTVNAFVADPPSATVFVGGTATLNVDSFSYNSNFTYVWTPSTYLQDTTIQQPYVQSPQVTTTYLVQVTDVVNGCVAYDSVRLAVVPPGVPPMPNAFSPNGDGANDVYGPYFPPSLQGAYTIVTMRIYNRWGQLVYNGNGYWDGTFSGSLQPADTYFYYVTISGPDQNNPNVNINYNLTGAFTLLH